MTDVTAIVCAYGPQPYLSGVVDALRASEGVRVEVIVVDNGSPDCAELRDATVLTPGRNTGFAGGCNLGARAARGQTLAFVNSDALVDPGCLARLHESASAPGAGLVGATVLLADEPDVVNSWGNPVHLLGFSWAGGYGHPASEAVSGPRASVSGAVFAVRRETFNTLGGMDEEYFLYGEDTDLSLRTWLAGLPVEVRSDARAWHHYDFARNPEKFYRLERNRLITVLTTYRPRSLFALAPLMLAAEAAMLDRSRREGWSAQKLAGYRWLLSHRSYLRRRRNRLQGSRRRDDAVLFDHLDVDLAPPERFGLGVKPRWRSAIRGYWSALGRRLAG